MRIRRFEEIWNLSLKEFEEIKYERMFITKKSTIMFSFKLFKLFYITEEIQEIEEIEEANLDFAAYLY